MRRLRTAILQQTQLVFGGMFALSIITQATACSSNGSGTSETASSAVQALGESEESPSFTMSIPLPAGIDIQTVAVGASNVVRLADRVQVPNNVFTTGTAANWATIEVGADAIVGPITSYGNVTLRDRAKITGDVVAAGDVEASSTVNVSGTVSENAVLEVENFLSWDVSVSGPNLGQITLEPNTTRDIAPGRYGFGSVKAGSKLALHSGIYYFDDLTIESQGRLAIDDSDGPVQIYVGNSFTFRGKVIPVTYGTPKLLVGVRGTGGAMIEASFTGVVIAPQGDVRVQAAQPDGHQGAFVGKNVSLEPDTIVRLAAFDWTTVVGGKVNPDYPDDNPHLMLPSVTDVSVYVDATGIGKTTQTVTPGAAVTFTLPADYTVSGGIIANGNIVLTYTNEVGTSVVCTYKGQSSTAIPTTPEDLMLARVLKLVSCSDGQGAGLTRTGTAFTTTLTPAPGLPVSIDSPVREVGACHDEVELLTALQTYNLRKSFSLDFAPSRESQDCGCYSAEFPRTARLATSFRQRRTDRPLSPTATLELSARHSHMGRSLGVRSVHCRPDRSRRPGRTISNRRSQGVRQCEQRGLTFRA